MNKNRSSLLKRLGRVIVSVGPAFFVVGYTIGTGSVVTMASAGSRCGMSLLWALVMACIFSYIWHRNARPWLNIGPVVITVFSLIHSF
jgi:manganese transport protein